jgi:hypothetical protein
VKRTTSQTIASVASSVLAEVEKADQIKTAEVQVVRAATPSSTSDLGTLIHKLAAELRSADEDVTYQDLADVMGGRV